MGRLSWKVLWEMNCDRVPETQPEMPIPFPPTEGFPCTGSLLQPPTVLGKSILALVYFVLAELAQLLIGR